MFPEEKIRNEVATIRYIQDHTAIPVPFILHWGTREESPLGIGPFIIMDYINHEMNMTAALNTPGLTLDIPPVLDPNIDEAKLEMLYRQVANILLQLSKLELPLIGALEETHEWSWEVTRRPLSMPMNELVRTGTFPRAKLPTSTFKTSSEYFQALAKLHVDHLASQRNDAVESRADCQRKYTARQLFQKLARERKLVSDRYDKGPFKFWCDDLRPSNILLDANLQIVAVIDWEFSYAAPSEFTFAPPWWLLIEQPEYW
ncbi:Protein kinase-like domain protein [Metarhizium brunneum]